VIWKTRWRYLVQGVPDLSTLIRWLLPWRPLLSALQCCELCVPLLGHVGLHIHHFLSCLNAKAIAQAVVCVPPCWPIALGSGCCCMRWEQLVGSYSQQRELLLCLGQPEVANVVWLGGSVLSVGSWRRWPRPSSVLVSGLRKQPTWPRGLPVRRGQAALQVRLALHRLHSITQCPPHSALIFIVNSSDQFLGGSAVSLL